MKQAKALSLTLPLNEKPYNSQVLFPFFDGLIPKNTKTSYKKEGTEYWCRNEQIYIRNS